MELALSKLKVFSAKAWSFLKFYWKEFAFAVVLVYLLFFVKQKTNLIEELIQGREKIRKEHKENIDRLNQQIQNEIATRRKIESNFQELIERISKQHSDEIKRIASVREEEIKALIRLHQNDPVLMARTINNIFGVPVMTLPTDKQSWEP